MITQEKLELLASRSREAVANYRENRRLIEAEVTRPAAIGDEFLIRPCPDDIDTTWLVISQHPDDIDLFFCVPTDSGTCLIGLCDVFCRDEQQVARCGYGLWLTRDFFDLTLRVGIHLDRWAQRCRRKMGQFVRGKLEGTQSQWESDANPDYDELLEAVARASYQVEARRDEISLGS